VRGVKNVRSIAAGPADLDDARRSPLWRRLLLPEKTQGHQPDPGRGHERPGAPRRWRQAVLRKSEAKNFRLELAGMPFMVDSIRRNLQHDSARSIWLRSPCRRS
jgi:hypothetical protein